MSSGLLAESKSSGTQEKGQIFRAPEGSRSFSALAVSLSLPKSRFDKLFKKEQPV
jgi:hypothetical protein